MNKIILLIVVVLFASVYPQSNWTNVKETNITAGLFNGVDIFTNRYGNHIIVQESNILKYYRMDVNGYSNPALFPRTIEEATVVSPSITGDDNNIYIVYGLGNDIKVKRSITGGLSWSLWATFSLLTPIPGGGMESVFSSEKLHVTYLESAVVKYIQRASIGGSWFGPITVSEGETGNFPRITAYKNDQMDFVYFMYRKDVTYNYECKWRRFNLLNNTWHTPLYKAPIENINIIRFSGFRVDNSNVIIYYRWFEEEPSHQEFFRWVILDLYNNWIDYGYSDVNNAINDRMYSTPTVDGKTHTALYFVRFEDQIPVVGLWRSYTADTVYPPDPIYGYEEPEDSIWHLNLSSAGNEVHVIWQDPFGSNYVYNLRYKYDDQVPIAPQNLTSFLDPDPSCNNCHGSGPGIRLDWAKNNEPDLSYYTIYRAERSCNSCHGSGSSSPPDTSSSVTEPVTVSKECPALQGEITDFSSSKVEVETGCLSGLKSTQKIIFEPIWAWSQNYWVDKNIQEDYTYLYFVTAKDVTSHESGQSNITSTIVPPGSFSKIFSNFSGEVIPKIYLLYQNYPNPFNPVTTIRYQVPEDVYVTLEVFNFLGQKVRTLVSELKVEGYYSVVWDGKNDFNQLLPSGIYYYRLTTDKFTATKKLILLK